MMPPMSMEKVYELGSVLRYVKVFLLDSTDSTMDAVQYLCTSTPCVVMALEQRAGRGRTGPWISRRGGLYMSLAIKDDYVYHLDPLRLQVAVGASIAYVLRKDLGIETYFLWPNDIVVNGRKLGGVLIEKHRNLVVIGVGVNVWNDPGVRGAISIMNLIGKKIDIIDLGIRLTEAILGCISMKAVPGYVIRSLDFSLGRRVRVKTIDGVVEGISLGVTERGTLIIWHQKELVEVDCCSVDAVEGCVFKSF